MKRGQIYFLKKKRSYSKNRFVPIFTLSSGFERYAVSKGVSANDASKASNTLGALGALGALGVVGVVGVVGVWDTLVINAGDIFNRD